MRQRSPTGAVLVCLEGLHRFDVSCRHHRLDARSAGGLHRDYRKVARGKRQLHDGPYADTDEQIGGYFVIEVANLDRSLEWAELCPAAVSGAVEVRPLMQECVRSCVQ